MDWEWVLVSLQHLLRPHDSMLMFAVEPPLARHPVLIPVSPVFVASGMSTNGTSNTHAPVFLVLLVSDSDSERVMHAKLPLLH